MRSLLYVPASRPDMLEKIPRLAADAVSIDLEDGVPPGEKESARDCVRDAFGRGLLDGARDWMLRINPVGTPWHEDDLALAETVRPPFVLVPKCEDREEISDLATWFSGHGSSTALMLETAAGVGEARVLAGCHPRIEVLVLGSADLRRSLGAPPDPGRAWELHALGEVLLAARMHDCLALDGVYFHFRDPGGLERHARVARSLGYDGKSCIHPGQIPVIHEVFSSDPEETAWANRILEAWRAGDGDRRGVVAAEGEMIEALHVAMAERILARRPGAGPADAS